MTSSSSTTNHNNNNNKNKNADNKNGGGESQQQQQQQYRRYAPPTDMNQHLTQILQQMNSSDIPIAIKGYNSLIETLKNETYTAQKQFVQSCQSKSQQYNLAHLAKKVQQQQNQSSSSSSYEKNQGLIPLDNLSHFYMYEHGHHERNSSTSSSLSSSITVYRSADFLPAFGGVNHDSILVQYILKSPQMHELKKLHEIFLKLLAERDYETVSIIKSRLFFLYDLIFKFTTELDKKTEWAQPNSPHEHEYRLVKQAIGSFANFVIQECWYAYVMLFQKFVGHEAPMRQQALSTLGILARYHEKQFDVFDMFKDKFLELRSGGRREDLHTFTLSLMSHGDAPIITTMTSKITFDWTNLLVIDFVNESSRAALWSVLSFLHRHIARNERIESHARKMFLTKHVNHMIQYMDPIMYDDALGGACSNLMQVILSDLFMNNKYALVRNDPTKFRFMREMEMDDSFMCRNLSKFNVAIPSHVNFVRRVLLKRRQYILPFLSIVPSFVFDDSLESLQRCNFLMTLAELPLPNISKQDILNYESSIPAITNAAYLYGALKIPDNVHFATEAMTVVLQAILTYFSRVESIMSQVSELSSKYSTSLDSWRRFELSIKQALKQQFPVSFITFYEYYFIHLTKLRSENSSSSSGDNKSAMPHNVHDFLLGRCLLAMRLYIKHFVAEDIPATILSLFKAIVPSAALVYQYVLFLSDLRVPFVDVLSNDLLERVLTVVTLDGSNQRSFSRKMLSPLFLSTSLFSSHHEFNTWMRMITRENVPFVAQVFSEVHQGTASESDLKSRMPSLLDTKLIGTALFNALGKSLSTDTAPHNIDFVYRVTAVQLLSRRYQDTKSIVADLEKVCKDTASSQNVTVLKKLVSFMSGKSSYESQFEHITVKVSSIAVPDADRVKAYEPTILSMVYSNIDRPALKEMQVQKFLSQKFDVTTTRLMSNLFSHLPFDILLYQHELSVHDTTVTQYLEPLQQYLLGSIEKLGDIHEHVSAIRQTLSSFLNSESPSLYSSILISILQGIYKKFGLNQFVESIKIVFGEVSKMHEFLARDNHVLDVELVKVWRSIFACTSQEQSTSALHDIWERYLSKLCTAIPSRVSRDRPLMQSVIDLLIVLPLEQSQHLMRVMITHKSDLLVDLLCTPAIQSEEYSASLSSIVLNDRTIYDHVAASLSEKNRPLLSLFHAIVSYSERYVLHNKHNEEVTYTVDPFVCIEGTVVSSLLKEISKSAVHAETCSMLVANSCAYDEEVLSYIHGAIKKQKVVSAEVASVLSAYVSSLIRVGTHSTDSKLVLNDVLIKDIIVECGLVSKLYNTISDASISALHCKHVLEVAKFINEQSAANLSHVSVQVLSDILAISLDKSSSSLMIDKCWTAKNQFSVAQALFVSYLSSAVQHVELRTAVVFGLLSRIVRSVDKKNVKQSYGVHVMVHHVRSLLSDPKIVDHITENKSSVTSHIAQFVKTVLLESSCLENNDLVLLCIDLLKLKLLSDNTIESVTNELLKNSSYTALITSNNDQTERAVAEAADDILIDQLLQNSTQSVGTPVQQTTLLTLLLQLLRGASTNSRQVILEGNSSLLAKLLSIYGARLSEKDLILYDLFTAFEQYGGTSLAKHYYAFGNDQLHMNKQIYEAQAWNNFRVDGHFLDTVHNFPNRVKLYSNHESVTRHLPKSADASVLYDPRFVLRWILFLTIVFNNDNMDTAMFASPALAIAVRATGSRDYTMRQLAYEILARISLMMKKQLRNAKAAAKKIPTEYSLLLGFLVQLKASIKSPYKMIPNLMALFLSKIAYTLRNPADSAYAQCVRFFTRTSFIKLDSFPVLQQSLFASMSAVGYDWLMDFLVHGASETRSAFQFETAQPKKNLLQEILLLFNSSSTNTSTSSKVNSFVIRFLHQLSSVDKGGLCVSNGVLSWCAQQLVEPTVLSDGERDSFLQILTRIVESYSLRSMADPTSLVNQIHSVIRVALTLPMSNQLVIVLLHRCFTFIHRLLNCGIAKQELRNKQFIDIQSLKTLIDAIDHQSYASVEPGLEVVILSTLTVPSLSSHDATLVANRLCDSSESVDALVSVIQTSLQMVHRALDRNMVPSTSKLPELLLRWLASILYCVSLLDHGKKSRVMELVHSRTGHLLLPFYSRKCTRTLNALQSLNFIYSMLYPFVSSQLVSSDDVLNMLDTIPTCPSFLSMSDLRSYSSHHSLAAQEGDRRSNVQDQQTKISTYLSLVHSHASIMFRRTLTFDAVSDTSMVDGDRVDGTPTSKTSIPSLSSTIEWIKEKMDDFEKPESLTVSTEDQSMDDGDLYDFSRFTSGKPAAQQQQLKSKPTQAEESDSDDSDSDDSSSDSDSDSDDSDSDSDDEEQDSGNATGKTNENRSEDDDSSSDEESDSDSDDDDPAAQSNSKKRRTEK